MSRREPQRAPHERPSSSRSALQEALPLLNLRQRQLVQHCLQRLQRAERWRGDLPVLVLERCWLRLSAVAVEQLAAHLPPDCSPEAPELVRYRELLAAGHAPLVAEQLCWLDFGMEACREAQQRFWRHQELGNQGWTLTRYLEVVQQYRRRLLSAHPQPLPLLVRARQGEATASSHHQLHWLGAEHT
jgi:hypothetical protein